MKTPDLSVLEDLNVTEKNSNPRVPVL